MKEICRIDFEGNSKNCSGNNGSPTIETAEFSAEKRLSEKDLEKKRQVKNSLIDATKKCYKNGMCEPIEVLGIRWEKCEVCDEHLPKLREDVIKPLIDAGIPIQYKELDAKGNGKKDFIEAGCQGTPCIIVKKQNDTKRRIYDGRQETIGAMSKILGFPNPLFYDVSDKRPENLVKPSPDFSQSDIIDNNRSIWL